MEPAAADANEPVPQSTSEIKSEMPPENESSLEHPAEVCLEPEQESHTETEVQTEAPAVPAESKKKGIPCWTLAVVSALALGLLAETVCLMMQHQTISRQQTEILCLRQRIAHKKQAEQVLPKSTRPQPNRQKVPAKPVAPAAKEEKSGTPLPSPIPSAATDRGARKPNIPEKESTNSTDTSEKTENGNIHKEDIPHEM